MIRVTFEILPGGDEVRKQTIGLMEIDNVGGDPAGKCNYDVQLKKQPPWNGFLKKQWRGGRFTDDDLLTSSVEGFDRVRRGVYDLVYCGLRACGLAARNK